MRSDSRIGNRFFSIRCTKNPLLSNRPLSILYLGELISHFGDALFNLAVMWTVYAHTKSAFATALLQVAWQLSDAIAGPIAGVLADRWDRKRIMFGTSILSALTVGMFAVMVLQIGMSVGLALGAIVLMNFWTTFFRPARASILPQIVDARVYTAVIGWFSTGKMVASLIGSAVGGVIVATIGTV